MEKLRILNELRPASEGFAGIPQETRIVHSVLAKINNVALTGMLNGNVYPLKDYGRKKKDQLYYKSRAVLDLAEVDAETFVSRSLRHASVASSATDIKIRALLGLGVRPSAIDLSQHGDFVWQAYFSKTLAPEWYETIREGRYATLSTPWAAMHLSGYLPPFRRSYIKMDTSNYDVMISQTPWPTKLSPNTQHVIRYHDAIPMFYPHTIHSAKRHQFTHYFPLKMNLARGAKVVCNSENSRRELLDLFPQAEASSEVIPCIVSDAYRPEEPASPEVLRDIVESNIEPDTAPKFRTPREAQLFYRKSLGEGEFNYVMMVSTIEPRKNHGRLIAAWNALRLSGHPDLKLIVVGRPGWHITKTLERMRPLQQRGLLFNISRVSSGDLRKLYRGARAVVCPSIAEGFDLSGIEAMLSGGLVAASDIPVHREIYEDACTYFDPYSTSGATDAIRQIMEGDKNFHDELRAKGARTGGKYKHDMIAPKWENYVARLQAK